MLFSEIYKVALLIRFMEEIVKSAMGAQWVVQSRESVDEIGFQVLSAMMLKVRTFSCFIFFFFCKLTRPENLYFHSSTMLPVTNPCLPQL